MDNKYQARYKEQLMAEYITPDIQGFWYVNKAIELYEPFTKFTELYTDIAKMYDTTPSRVESCIRRAIARSGEKITNSRYIAVKKLEWEGWGGNRDLNFISKT